MKLLIILSLIACSYGDKLDRTYLPPESAGTAGGSPGSIAAPGTENDLGVPKGTTFGQPAGSLFGQPSGSSFGQPRVPSFGQATAPSVGQPKGPSFGQPSDSSFGQLSGSSFGQPTGSSFGQSSSSSFGQPSGQSYGQSSDLSISGQSTFGQGANQEGPKFGSTRPGQAGAGRTASQYNQAGTTADAGTAEFVEATNGFNKSPAFGGEPQTPTSYTGSSEPERARASIDRNAETLSYENNIDGDTFAYSFETSNGIAANEAGIATNGVQAQGGFSYTGDDGQFYSVRYTADENGYVPQGDHLPTPHPIPEEILKSLEENAKAAAAGTQEGAYDPNEDLAQNNGASYPGSASNEYQPDQSSASQYSGPSTLTVTAKPQGGQEFSSKNDAPVPSFGLQGSLGARGPQYKAPASSPTSYARPGTSGYRSQSNQILGSQYDTPGISSFASRPGSQDGQSPTSQYTDSLDSGLSSQKTTFSTYDTPTGTIEIDQQGPTKPGSQRFSSQDRANLPTQYGAPDTSSSSSTSPRFPTQGSQSFLANDANSFDSSEPRPGFPKQPSKSPFSQSASASSSGSKRPFGSQGFPSQNGAQTPISEPSTPDTAPGTNNKNSGYQYNSPSAFSANSRPALQRFPSQVSSTSVSQFDKLGVAPSNTNGLNGPQSFTTGSVTGSKSFRPYGSLSATSQYNAPVSSSLRPVSQVVSSPPTQYDTSAGLPFSPTSLSGSQVTPTGPPSSIGASLPVNSQSSTSQYNTPSSTTFGSTNTDYQSSLSGQAEFKRPQFGFSTPSSLAKSTNSGLQGQNESGYKYSRPQTQFSGQQDKILPNQQSGSTFRPSGPVGSSKIIGNGFVNDNGLTRESSGLQGSSTLEPVGNYKPFGSQGSVPKGTANASGFSKLTEIANQNYPSRTSLPGSTGLGSRPADSSFPRQDNTVRPLGITRQYQSSQNSGSKFSMPASSGPYQYNSPESTGFGLSGQKRPGQVGYQSPFGSSGQKQPGQVGYQSNFGLSVQERPGQVESQLSPDTSREEKPGQYRPGFKETEQVGSQSGYGFSKQKPPGQQPDFSLSGQDRPGQFGKQPSFGSSGQQSTGLNGSPSIFGTSGTKSPGQIGFQSPFNSSGQDRPGQLGKGKPTESFNGPRQPQSFSPEEGYKY